VTCKLSEQFRRATGFLAALFQPAHPPWPLSWPSGRSSGQNGADRQLDTKTTEQAGNCRIAWKKNSTPKLRTAGKAFKLRSRTALMQSLVQAQTLPEVALSAGLRSGGGHGQGRRFQELAGPFGADSIDQVTKHPDSCDTGDKLQPVCRQQASTL
jgi:hypothetical protein